MANIIKYLHYCIFFSFFRSFLTFFSHNPMKNKKHGRFSRIQFYQHITPDGVIVTDTRDPNLGIHKGSPLWKKTILRAYFPTITHYELRIDHNTHVRVSLRGLDSPDVWRFPTIINSLWTFLPTKKGVSKFDTPSKYLGYL